MFFFYFVSLQRATLAEKEVNTLKEQLTSTTTSKTQTNTTLSNSTTTTTITQNGTSPPSPSTTPLSLLSDNNDNHSSSNKLLNNNSIKSCHLDDENMDKKLNDINEMIDHNQEDEDDVKERMNNHCSSNRSTPTSDKEKEDDDIADNDDAAESRDNGDRCSVNSSVNKNSVSTRTMAEELALKDKEVSWEFNWISINYSPALLFVRCINFHPRQRDVLRRNLWKSLPPSPSGKTIYLADQKLQPLSIERKLSEWNVFPLNFSQFSIEKAGKKIAGREQFTMVDWNVIGVKICRCRTWFE